MQVEVVKDFDTLSRRAADLFGQAAIRAVRAKGRFAVALSGGSTPRGMYEILGSEPTRNEIPWSTVHLFWGDERWLPPDHPASNYSVVRATLLSKVDVPAENIHSYRTGLGDPERAASDYEETLRQFFSIPEDGFPRFDLILLGLGEDGHIASLFPGNRALLEARRWVVAPWVEVLGAHRLSLTVPVLNQAHRLLGLVSGEKKASALREALQGEERPDQLPALHLRGARGRVLWLVDQAAASLLEGRG